MASTETRYEHIALDETGVPFIVGTTTKVVELVAERKAYGWSPEELHLQHPYLALGQIYSALAYYSDHAASLEGDLEGRLRKVDEARKAAGKSPLAARLKSTR
jgi:uncharacterized protein (DUF433 family)